MKTRASHILQIRSTKKGRVFRRGSLNDGKKWGLWMGKHRIFVYGTLKQDHRNHRFLKNALRVGTTVTADASFRMVELSSRSSPGLRSPGVREDGEGYIAGEVYEVDNQTRTELDKLEQEGVQYKRHLVSLRDGTLAEIYLLMAQDGSVSETSERIGFDPETKIYDWRPGP